MKKILALSTLALLLPFLVNAATLNNTFNVGTLFPVAGGTTNISSSCGTAGANSTVSFALMKNGNTTTLSPNFSTDSNGAFSGTITFPSSYGSGPATLVATCNRTGDTINSPVLTFAAPASTSFGLPSSLPTVGGLYNISGSCGSSNGSGNVQLTLNNNGSNYQLGSMNLNSDATFSGNVIIPNNASTGSATLIASCSNGNSFSSNLNIGPAAVNSFTISSNPFPGANVTISGNCTNINGNQNGAVTFSVLRSGTNNNLPASNNLTNNSGTFSALVSFPSNIGSDPATLVVTCPNGSTFSNVIMLGTVVPAVLAADIITPVGGVAAGYGVKENPNYLVGGEILLIAGLLGLSVLTAKNFYARK